MIGIAGWGCVSALGLNVSDALMGLYAGRRGQVPAKCSKHLLPVNGQPPLVCEVPLDVPLRERPKTIMNLAVDEALAMAGPYAGVTGVFVGTTGGFFVDSEIDLYHRRQANPNASPWFGGRGIGSVAEAVAERVGALGPILTYSTACTSGSVALSAAASHVRAGTCDRAIVVGFDLLANMTVYGFRSLLLTDPVPSRPFDPTRAGLQLGEGCGVVVLQRGEGRFSVLHSANRIDPTSMTGGATDGGSVETVIREALRRSGVTPEQVVSIKAHGTGTVDNDLAEGNGIRRIWGEHAPAFASLKGALGHTLGAAGAVEMALWLGALQAGKLPPSIGFSETDPAIGITPLKQVTATQRGVHLFNAFGFGGSCVAYAVADV